MDHAVGKKKSVVALTEERPGIWRCTSQRRTLYFDLEAKGFPPASSPFLKTIILDDSESVAIAQGWQSNVYGIDADKGAASSIWYLTVGGSTAASTGSLNRFHKQLSILELLSFSHLLQWFADKCVHLARQHPNTESDAFLYDAKSKDLQHEAYQYDVVEAQKSWTSKLAQKSNKMVIFPEEGNQLLQCANGQRRALVNVVEALWLWRSPQQHYRVVEWIAFLLLSLLGDVIARINGRVTNILTWQQKALLLLQVGWLSELEAVMVPHHAHPVLYQPYLLGAAFDTAIHESNIAAAQKVVSHWPQLPMDMAAYYIKDTAASTYKKFSTSGQRQRGLLSQKIAFLFEMQKHVVDYAIKVGKSLHTKREIPLTLTLEEAFMLPPYYQKADGSLIPIVTWREKSGVFLPQWYEKVPDVLKQYFQ